MTRDVMLAVHPRARGRRGVPSVVARSGVPAVLAVATALASFVVRKST